MDIAKKLREVVTSNFIEIVRSEEDDRKKGTAPPYRGTGTAAPSDAPVAAAPEPIQVPTDHEDKARRELDELESFLKSSDLPEETPAEEEPTPLLAHPEGDEGDIIEPEAAHPVEAPEGVLAAVAEAPLTVDYSDPMAMDDEMQVVPLSQADEDATVQGVIPITMEGMPALDALAEPETAEEKAPTVVTPETAAETVAPQAQPLAQENPVLENPVLENPAQFVNADGSIDFARMLRMSNLPPVPFSSDQARKIIVALPEELPMKVKRMTVKATLDAVSPNNPVDPKDVVADAMLKRIHVAQFRDALHERIEANWRQKQTDIENYKDEIERLITELRTKAARMEEEIVVEQHRQRAAFAACNEHIAQLEQVILFFQTDEALIQADNAAENTDEEEDIPPFMRDDTVYRLLGLNNSEPENSGGEEADPTRNGESPDSGRRRGRR